ncbi:MmgE/PrpD family protein [Paenibacillus periandrae]|uniref:MmgE/PrpD family protein n=1 Tax=Paenibacillus periandrae TaxID=1761741 RepID=UPI001F0969AB|nr:MmgE/PrpD family protein [Paenibacillus periandrae]
MSITTKLAQFFAEMEYDNLPAAVIEKSKENLIDNLGGAIGAIMVPDVKGNVDVFHRYDQSNDCTIWGTDKKTSVTNAALLNGIAAHALEMDDFHPLAKIHMGTVVVPAAITLGEFHRISGKQLLAALAVGYEIGIRIGMGVGTSSHRMRGWHATSTIGIFGATLSAAKIIGMDVEQTVSALGIAGTQSSGLWAFMEDGASNKKLHAGHAAECGIKSALLASGGMTGPRAILEASDGGFYRATSDEYNFDIVTEGLGENYELMRVGRKPYACCRSMHLSIDGVLEVRKEYAIQPEDIVKIDVFTYEIGVKQCGIFQIPQNVFEAKFSIPYGIAVALYDGAASIRQFEEERITDPKLLELAGKVNVYSTEKYTKEYPRNWGCEMKIYTRDGKEITKVVWNGKGGVDKPLTRDDLILKFKSLAGVALPESRMDEIIHMIFNLEEVSDISQLTALLKP